jgi:pilus assembly protein CpaB
MNIRLVALLLVAVIAAGGAVFAASSWINAQRAELERAQNKPKPKVTAIEVLVARETLPTGVLLRKDHFRWQAWPDTSMSPNYVQRDRSKQQEQIDELVGAVVRNPITSGEPVTQAKIVHPGERGFMAAVLKPNHRAITVPVNAVTGIAGFVFPGDRVDLLLTHDIKQGKKTRHATETVLSDVRVLAIDQSTNDQADKAKVSKNVTLELMPKQAEMVTLITAIGRLSLSLRSLQQEELEPTLDPNMSPEALLASLTAPEAEAEEEERTRGHTWDTEVSRLLYSPNNKPRKSVKLVRGGKSTVVQFAQGDEPESVIDVSPRDSFAPVPTLALPQGTLPGVIAGTAADGSGGNAGEAGDEGAN